MRARWARISAWAILSASSALKARSRHVASRSSSWLASYLSPRWPLAAIAEETAALTSGCRRGSARDARATRHRGDGHLGLLAPAPVDGVVDPPDGGFGAAATGQPPCEVRGRRRSSCVGFCVGEAGLVVVLACGPAASARSLARNAVFQMRWK
jgi:hypothetical protein